MKQNSRTARHIVVVDEDRKARAVLVEYLQKSGFDVTGTTDTRALSQRSERRIADLVILDLAVADDDAFGRCAMIRDDLGIPVIATSASADDVERILALEIGADDFIAKPFNPREVVARVRNLLRRLEMTTSGLASQPGERYSFAGWTLDTTSRSLLAPNGEELQLAGGEFELLFALVTHANRVLTRDQLLELTKGRTAQPFDRSIDVRISRLRQRLGDHAQSARIIKAIYGKGYVLATPVAIVA